MRLILILPSILLIILTSCKYTGRAEDKETNQDFSETTVSVAYSVADAIVIGNDCRQLILREATRSQIDSLVLVKNLSGIEVLDLSMAELQHLPESIFQLKNLRSLNLSHNRLSTLPTEITKLSYLGKLDLLFNEIGSIPQFLCELDSLKFINLNGNPVGQMPDCLDERKGLTVLISN